MYKNQIESIFNDTVSALRINREKVANIVWGNPELFSELVKKTFEVTDKNSIKAAWVLEYLCTHKGLELIIPYLHFFTNNIKNLRFDSVKRPCAKICEHLAVAYSSKQPNLITKNLTKNHIDKIVETGFDWLIGQEKIAVKAYTMQTLYLFGLEIDWVHTELAHLIRTSVIHQSKGCEARGKKILGLLAKQKK